MVAHEYIFRFLNRFGIWGYVFVGAFFTGFLVGVRFAPEIAIPVFVFCGLILWFAGIKPFVEEERLNEIGLDGEARILSFTRTGSTVQIGGAEPLKGVSFDVEVTILGRPTYPARIKTHLRSFDFPQFQPGTVVKVKVDPEKLERVAIAR